MSLKQRESVRQAGSYSYFNRHFPSYFHDVEGEVHELSAEKLHLKYTCPSQF